MVGRMGRRYVRADSQQSLINIYMPGFHAKNKTLLSISSYIAPPIRPTTLDHHFLTYFTSYLSGIEKIILISHI